MPTTFSGRFAAAAISPIGSVDVFDAMMQCSGTTASISLTTACLTSICSKTASITMSACPKWRLHDGVPSVTPTTFDMRVSRANGVIRRRFTFVS